MADNTARSILLQVAFKAGAENGGTIDEVKNLTVDYFTLLEGLHKEFGIEIKDKEFGSKFPAKAAAAKPAAGSDDAPVVTIQGEQYFDYRDAKSAGTKPERWPDFKKVGDKTNKGSEWLIDKDGVTPTAFAKLVSQEGL